jgi:hypothetical protein
VVVGRCWALGSGGSSIIQTEVAQAEVHRRFSVVSRHPGLTTAGGVYGTLEQVWEQLAALVAMGANHLLLIPVTRHTEQVEALAEVVGLQHSATGV